VAPSSSWASQGPGRRRPLREHDMKMCMEPFFVVNMCVCVCVSSFGCVLDRIYLYMQTNTTNKNTVYSYVHCNMFPLIFVAVLRVATHFT
jgi:hypothetical protein